MSANRSPGNVVKIVELVGSSDQSFSDAVRNAVRTAGQTIRGITGVDVIASSASVGPDGELSMYKVDCKIAFVIEERASGSESSGGSAQADSGERAQAETTRPTDDPPPGITAETISSVDDGESS